MKITVSGFAATGPLPNNLGIFTEAYFLPNAREKKAVSNEEEITQCPVTATHQVAFRHCLALRNLSLVYETYAA